MPKSLNRLVHGRGGRDEHHIGHIGMWQQLPLGREAYFHCESKKFWLLYSEMTCTCRVKVYDVKVKSINDIIKGGNVILYIKIVKINK